MELLTRVFKAKEVLKEVVRRTDLIPAFHLRPDCKMYLKAENLQTTGSFKIRGAYYKISQLTDEEKQRGIVACSAGNHAQGVALAAKYGNINATICIPKAAPLSKIEMTRSYGVNVELVDGVYDDAYERALEICEKEGRIFIHPFNDLDVIAGQGTIALEILDQLTDVDTIVVPIGGGGLISGIAATIKQLKPSVEIIGVQALGAPSMLESTQQQCMVKLSHVATIADGIAVKQPGNITFDMVCRYVDKIVTVSEEEIATAILTLMEKQKIVTEGAGAVATAAVLFSKFDVKNKNIVCLISGGNIDVSILSKVINMGLVKAGRMSELRIQLYDKPGQLTKVTEIIAQQEANIVSISHDRLNELYDVSICYVDAVLETRDRQHVKQIKRALIDQGFQIIEPQAN